MSWKLVKGSELIYELDIYEKLSKRYPDVDHETLCRNQKRLLKQKTSNIS